MIVSMMRVRLIWCWLIWEDCHGFSAQQKRQKHCTDESWWTKKRSMKNRLEISHLEKHCQLVSSEFWVLTVRTQNSLPLLSFSAPISETKNPEGGWKATWSVTNNHLSIPKVEKFNLPPLPLGLHHHCQLRVAVGISTITLPSPPITGSPVTILRSTISGRIQWDLRWKKKSPGSFLQAPPLLCKLPPVAFQLLQDFVLWTLDLDSRVPEPSQLVESAVLIPDALL